MRRSLLKKSLILVALIFVVNLLAYQFYWYSSIWYFDMIMHAAGGVFLALIVGAVAHQQIQGLGWWHSIVLMLLSVFIIGLLWEWYEYVVQWLTRPVPFASIDDSISDLICDMIGGVVGAVFVLRAKKRYTVK